MKIVDCPKGGCVPEKYCERYCVYFFNKTQKLSLYFSLEWKYILSSIFFHNRKFCLLPYEENENRANF